jgi:hypothetical protein
MLGISDYSDLTNRKEQVMKVLGIFFIIGGIFWTIAGFISYASDIQLGIAVSGMNMFGLGAVMVHLGEKKEQKA